MSEYQYYEFQKVDDRLSEMEMRELRAVSSRARITPTSFVNEYDFGNFKGNPDAWMEKYFDGFLYLANWGTREIHLAMPSGALPLKVARRYCTDRAISIREKSGKLIITFLSEEEPDGEWLEGDGVLSSLLQIRTELANGDLRSLYLGWLMGVQAGEVGEEEHEPSVPPNLGKLSGPQASLVDFFRLDQNLETAAAENSSFTKAEPANRKKLSAWVASLPSQAKDEIIVRLMTGEGLKVGMELHSQFRQEQDAGLPKTAAKPRTVAKLLAKAKP